MSHHLYTTEPLHCFFPDHSQKHQLSFVTWGGGLLRGPDQIEVPMGKLQNRSDKNLSTIKVYTHPDSNDCCQKVISRILQVLILYAFTRLNSELFTNADPG